MPKEATVGEMPPYGFVRTPAGAMLDPSPPRHAVPSSVNTFRARDILILGFMNFALYVGAGNIIFPPFIGLQAGTSVWAAAAGFLLTGVGLPVITSIAMARAGGSMSVLTRSVGRTSGTVLTIVCYLCIGPLFAIPRTTTVSYETAIQPFVGSDHWLWLFSLAYFAVVIAVSLHPGKLMDTVGKVLSPIKIVALIVLAITTLLWPAGQPGQPTELYAHAAFSQGLTNGYLTMDTLGALAFGIVIVNAIHSRGVDSPSLITRYAVLSGIIAGVGLALIYICLFLLGTGSNAIAGSATNGAEVLSAYVHYSYGLGGSVFLGVLITIACMVTAIGLTCACASYFSGITRIGYSTYVWIFAAFSWGVSNLGLTRLIGVSVPILTSIYPVFIVLIATFFMRPLFRSPSRVVVPVAIVALIVGSADALNAAGFDALSVVKQLPLHDQGLSWLPPVLVVMAMAALADRLGGPGRELGTDTP